MLALQVGLNLRLNLTKWAQLFKHRIPDLQAHVFFIKPNASFVRLTALMHDLCASV